jgi:PEP-CTERM motif
MRDSLTPRAYSASARFLVLTTLLLLFYQEPARAGFIATVSANVKPLSNGLDEYDYAVSSSPQSTVDGYIFALTVDATANLQSISNPSGWSADYTGGSTTIIWSTGTTPLTPGDSTLFSFDSALTPSLSPYQVTGFDPTGIQFYPSNGTTLAPAIASVPEPNSLVLSGIGALGALAMLARRSRRAPSTT